MHARALCCSIASIFLCFVLADAPSMHLLPGQLAYWPVTSSPGPAGRACIRVTFYYHLACTAAPDQYALLARVAVAAQSWPGSTTDMHVGPSTLGRLALLFRSIDLASCITLWLYTPSISDYLGQFVWLAVGYRWLVCFERKAFLPIGGW